MHRNLSKLILSGLIFLAFQQVLQAQKPVTREEFTNQTNKTNNSISILRAREDSVERTQKILKGTLNNFKGDITAVKDSLTVVRREASIANSNTSNTQGFVNSFWVLLSAVLVFFMQAGFKCLEVGVARTSHNASTAVMNLMNWLVLCIFFYFIGYGFMFGPSSSHFFGDVKYWGQASTEITRSYKNLGLEHFLFQLAFAGTAATIVDGAILERTSLVSYFFISLVVGLFIYPVFGCWVWNNDGWLARVNFHDFAGSTVVHSVGAWSALMAVLVVGRRRYKFNEKAPDLQKKKFKPHNLGYSILGVIMLWFGWWGFNGGSQLEYDKNIASIILNTNLAGAAAGIISFFDAHWRDKDHLYEKIIGGVLGGLVAITASCDVVGPIGATIIGLIAGMVHNVAYDFLIKKRIDDVAGAIPVHGACGVLGTLLVGIIPFLFSFERLDGIRILEKSRNENLSHLSDTWLQQTIIQLGGITMAFAFTCATAWLLFTLIEKSIGIRTSIAEEDGEVDTAKLIENYDGTLQVSVRRIWNNWFFAWSKFVSWEATELKRNANSNWNEFISRAKDHKNKDILGLENNFSNIQKNYFQIIRDDDTPASLGDVIKKLNIVIPQQIFICYRKEETNVFAHFLKEKLEAEEVNRRYVVFIDSKGITGGQKNIDAIEENIKASSVFIVLMGNSWMRLLKEKINNGDDDWVSMEIGLAMKYEIPILPLFLNTEMPKKQDLPKAIEDLVYFTGLPADETLRKHFLEDLMNAINFHISKNSKQSIVKL